MRMLVDAHCHLPGPALGGPGALLARARAAGVSGFIAVGSDPETDRDALTLAQEDPGVRASLGVHPHEASRWDPIVEERLALLLEAPEVLFVGETGLDWHYDLSPREAQEAAFRGQIRLARRLGKPLMIHTREAPGETLRILREEGADRVGGIIHCFSEDKVFAADVLELGFHLSFSGILTFRKAETLQEVAAWAPEDRILVETDTPYLAPVPHRGRPNEPAFVVHVAECLARLRGVPLARMAERTTRNLEALCGWAPSF